MVFGDVRISLPKCAGIEFDRKCFLRIEFIEVGSLLHANYKIS